LDKRNKSLSASLYVFSLFLFFHSPSTSIFLVSFCFFLTDFPYFENQKEDYDIIFLSVSVSRHNFCHEAYDIALLSVCQH
jgi:hypothetical protein